MEILKNTEKANHLDTSSPEFFMKHINDEVAKIGNLHSIAVSPNLYSLMLTLLTLTNSNTLEVCEGKLYYIGVPVGIINNTEFELEVK